MAIKVNGKLVAGAGKSAYESAKDGGYTGTEDEFNTALRSVYKELHADHETGAADNK